MKSLTFNGIKKSWIYLLKGRSKPPFASVRRDLLTIAGRHGAFLRTSQKEPLFINQPIGFDAENDAQALRLKDELAEWLITDEPVSLQFDDEPNRTYYAIVQNTIEDFERIADFRQGTIQFLCLDPFSYGNELTQNITTNSTIVNDGTAETYPIFEIDVTEPITRLEITNKSLEDRQGASPSIVLGKTASLEQTPYTREELVFQDSMQSTSTWQQAAEIDNGYIAGEIGVDAKGFYPAKFGEAILPYSWQGPSLIKGIGTSLQDFRADIRIENLNLSTETGMLAVYFRDANSNKIANIGFGDAWTERAENFGHGQLGNYDVGQRVDAYADYAAGWNNFDGVIRIERIGNVWRFYYAQIGSDGTHNWIHSRSRITDNANAHIAPVTDIQVAFRLWAGTERTDLHIKEIKMYRINPPPTTSEKSVAYIAQAGDRLTINTKTQLIATNGEPTIDLAAHPHQMFPLAKGYNQIEVTPKSVKVKARYRNAYL